MKRFLIIISCLLGVALGGFACFYIGGIYIQTESDGKVTTCIRTRNQQIELQTDEGWEIFEIRGVNMGSGLPGEWSTDYAIDKETYLRWFTQIQDMGANVIRVHSIQNSAFYTALDKFNSERENPLYFIQGIWVNDYVQNSHMDAYDAKFRQRLLEDCKTAVDVLHGKRFTLKNDANTSTGLYLHDVSEWLLGYIIGAEWTDVTVRYTDEKYPEMDGYQGAYLYTTKEATPFETMLTEAGDQLIAYETKRYNQQHLVSFANGRMTDPFEYPEEVAEFFKKCASIDMEHIRSTDEFYSGMFASYSVYNYDTDFLALMEPAQWRDLLENTSGTEAVYDGNETTDTYDAYLKLLNLHHTIPVVVSEFGATTGRGMAQYNTGNDRKEGQLSEKEQSEAIVECYKDIVNSGCAGACVFSWQDEWHKRTWNTMYAADLSRNVYWHDVQTSDENFGLLAFEPGKDQSTCVVDGDISEWDEKDVVIEYDDGSNVSVKYDEAYLYLRIYKPDYVFGTESLYLPIDTTQKTGTSYCAKYNLNFQRDADFLLVIHNEQDSALLVQDRYHSIHANYEEEINGKNAYIQPPEKDSDQFEVIQMAIKDVYHQYEENKTSLDAFETGRLRYGDANPEHADYDSLADFMVKGENIEIRLPWLLLNFSDPSRMQIHDDYYDGNYGIQFIDLKELFIGLGDSNEVIEMGSVSLKGWGNETTYHERLKPAYYALQDYWTGGVHK